MHPFDLEYAASHSSHVVVDLALEPVEPDPVTPHQHRIVAHHLFGQLRKMKQMAMPLDELDSLSTSDDVSSSYSYSDSCS